MKSPIKAEIAVVTVAALLAVLGAVYLFGSDFVVTGDLLAFALLGIVFEVLAARLVSGATGSALFVAVSAVAALFGGLPAAVIGASAGLVGGLVRRRPLRRTLFNSFQHVVAVCVAWWTYRSLGGSFPPAYLRSLDGQGVFSAATDIALFFGFTSVYLIVNSANVALAISVTTSQRFLAVWSANTRGTAILDLGSASISLLLVASYSFSVDHLGSGVPGILLAGMPILVSRKSLSLFRELQASSEEMLQLMVKAIEARDPYTSGHSLRVQRLSVAIATDLGLVGDKLRDVATASLLHDVGKIHEEFAPILRKEGKLTEEERALMESHAERGAALVGVVSRFRGAIEQAVRHHHERWDGKGYPSKLAGEEIPQISRIILVADTIDAMTTDRPYRARLTFDAVVAELRKHSGTQFDPEIAEIATSSLSVRRIIVEPDTSSRPGSPIDSTATGRHSLGSK